MFDERILRVATDGGTSVLVGSADAGGVPACCRGIAVSTDHTLARATVYVPVTTSRDVIANAATTKKLAVMITRVVEHVGVQLKGTVEAIRLAGEDEGPFVRRRLQEFAEVLDEIGLRAGVPERQPLAGVRVEIRSRKCLTRLPARAPERRFDDLSIR